MKHAVEQCVKSNNLSLKKSHLIFKFDLKQFEAPKFTEKLIEIINRISKGENEIVIELMDGENHANLEVYREPILKLNEAKIPLVIGIFILGHFALNKLNQIHFTYLKIDEKLVQDLTKREESKVILGRILSLVDDLKLKTLTAGVDTEERKKLLESMGCLLMQGKIFKELSLD